MALTDTPQTTDSTSSDNAAPADDDALRRRLLSRIAVAGVTIVGLLGGLAVYDSLNKPQAPAMPPMAAVPAEPAEATKEPAAEEKPAEEKAPAAEEKAEEGKLAAAEPVPERSETPLATLPEAKPLTPPATARQAAVKPGRSPTAAVKPDPRREVARAVPEGTRGAPSHAPASRPLAKVADAARRFLVQVGVFSNHANAEELVQKLQAAGIPAQIESRVQVGPFASRAEADAARVKLKALGLDDGMLVRR
ncbi:MAG: SPOR domain-containing protein [Pseudomonadota bacterium]